MITGMIIASIVAVIVSIINIHDEDKELDYKNYEAAFVATSFAMSTLFSVMILEMFGASVGESDSFSIHGTYAIWFRICLSAILLMFSAYSLHLFTLGSQQANNKIEGLVDKLSKKKVAAISSEMTMELTKKHVKKYKELETLLLAEQDKCKSLESMIKLSGHDLLNEKIKSLDLIIDKLTKDKKYTSV